MNLELIKDSDGVCDYINITSDIFNDYFTNFSNSELKLTIKFNCCDTEFEVTIWEPGQIHSRFNPSTKVFKLLSEDFEQDDLLDSLLSLELEYKDLRNGSKVIERACFFVDCSLKCSVEEYIAANLSSDSSSALDKYLALTYTNDCSNCKCDNACLILEALLNQLSLSTDSLTNCGCND